MDCEKLIYCLEFTIEDVNHKKIAIPVVFCGRGHDTFRRIAYLLASELFRNVFKEGFVITDVNLYTVKGKK